MKHHKAGNLVEPLEGRVLFDISLPAGFAQHVVATGIDAPTTMAFSPDGRLFVLEDAGAVRIIQNGKLLAKPFLTLSVDTQGERGLLGIAFDPNFQQNHYLYLYHTVPGAAIHNQVSRFTARGNQVVPGSEVDILDLPTLTSIHHNAGAIHFGPDGKLYVAVGDNQDNRYNAQSLDTPLGKILRINPDGSIPTDNPFYNQTTGENRAIWAMGLRNPFTFAFQPGTGVMYINDVGDTQWEQIDQGVAGGNYGWPYTEGPNPNPAYNSPVYTYPHLTPATAPANSITGGTFYNPTVDTFPTSYVGCYFFGDNSAQWVHVYNPVTNTESDFSPNVGVVDLQLGPDGNLYIADRGTDSIIEVSFPGKPVTITKSPASQALYAGQSATFSVSAKGTGALTYQWQRDGVDIAGATSAKYTLDSTTVDDSGSTFTATVTDAFGPVISHSASLTVAAADAPLPAILTPKLGQLFSDGTRVSFSGKATDPSIKALKPSAFSWQVLKFDDGQSQVIAQRTGARNGSFAIPRTDDGTASDEFYRVELTVTNPLGESSITSQDIYPRLGTITLKANTADVDVVFDGQTVETPYTFIGVVGSLHELQAPLTQDVDTTAFNLAVKPPTRKLVVHTTPLTYVTRYRVTGGN